LEHLTKEDVENPMNIGANLPELNALLEAQIRTALLLKSEE